MTEYRVVCTLDTEHTYDRKKYHYDVANCWWRGRMHPFSTFKKRDAEEFLDAAKEECLKFDKETQANSSIKYRQTNIRIQTREVTEWK